jgi:transcriptional regulator with XRE-family HTH domain
MLTEMIEGDRQRIGKRIEARRKAAKPRLSRERLAQRAGLSAVTVYKIEHGDNVTFETLQKIAGALGVPVAELVE